MNEYDNIKILNDKMLRDNFPYYVLGVDIGGTNTNVGVAGVKNSKPNLLFSLNYKSKNLDSLVPVISNSLTYAKENYEIDIDFACIGAAGVVSPSNDFAQLTNVKWNISSNEILNETSLKKVHIINDFQAIGYSVNLLDHNNSNDMFQIRPGINENKSSTATKAIVGAGTGLGKSILVYDNNFNAYIPIPSEGGHSDFPVQNNFEIELVRFIKQLRGISNPLNYEEVISGRGIDGIYLFLRKTKKYSDTNYTDEIDAVDEKAPLISKYKNFDDTCRDTFKLFAQYYARCAKNFALETLPSGGLYIAGGIAVKNKEIFASNDFIHEFENAYRRADFLKTIPIHVILNYDVSLYGACYAAMYKLLSKQ